MQRMQGGNRNGMTMIIWRESWSVKTIAWGEITVMFKIYKKRHFSRLGLPFFTKESTVFLVSIHGYIGYYEAITEWRKKNHFHLHRSWRLYLDRQLDLKWFFFSWSFFAYTYCNTCATIHLPPTTSCHLPHPLLCHLAPF